MFGLLSPMLDGIKLFGKYDAILTRYVVSLVCPVGLMLVLCVNYSGLNLACGDSLVTCEACNLKNH